MPKIIKDAEGLIIKSGRKLFTGKDPRRFTTDRVARKSQMCKATLYKYIDSIDSLRKSVVLEDWAAAEEKLRKAMTVSSTPEERVSLLFIHLRKFANRYKNCTLNVFAGGGLLRSEIDITERLCTFTGLPPFMVEVILCFAPMQNIQYEDIKDRLNKLF